MKTQKTQLGAEGMFIKGNGVTISISEHQGRTEIIVQGKKHRVRLLNHKEGLEIGTPVEIEAPVKAKKSNKK